MIMAGPRSYEVAERPGTIPERSLGQLLNETFHVYGRNFWLIIGIVAVVQVPVGIVGLILGSGPIGYVGEFVLRWFASFYVYGALAFAAGQQYLTGEIDIGKSYSRVWWRVVSLSALTVIILAAFALGGGLFFLVFPVVLLLIFMVYWSVAVPAVIVQGSSSIDALRQSFRLVRGSWWRVFGISLVVGLVALGLSVLSSLPFMAGDALAGLGGPDALGTAMLALGSIVVAVVVVPIPAIAGTLLYYDLRVRKEGFDLPSLSREMGIVAV